MQDVSEDAQLKNNTQLPFKGVKSGFTYFEKGDVLLAKITPCFENGKGCHTADLPTNVGFGSTEFHVLRENEDSILASSIFGQLIKNSEHHWNLKWWEVRDTVVCR